MVVQNFLKEKNLRKLILYKKYFCHNTVFKADNAVKLRCGSKTLVMLTAHWGGKEEK